MLRIWLECPRNALLLGTDRAVCCRCYQDGSGCCITAVPVLCCGQELVKANCSERKRVTKPATGKCSLVSVTRCKISAVTFIAGMAPDLLFCPALGINSVFIWTPDVRGLLRVFEGFSGM